MPPLLSEERTVFCRSGARRQASRKRIVERKPGIIDWFEELVYTGLLCVAAAFLLLKVLD